MKFSLKMNEQFYIFVKRKVLSAFLDEITFVISVSFLMITFLIKHNMMVKIKRFDNEGYFLSFLFKRFQNFKDCRKKKLKIMILTDFNSKIISKDLCHTFRS